MSEILKVFTPEQLTELSINQILAQNVSLTNFNVGSRNRTILEAVAALESMTGMDYVQALRQSIPTAFYDGLNFTRKPATASIGFTRYYRLPEISIRYTGVGVSNLLTVDAVHLETVVAGIPADNLNLAFATYPTLGQLVTAINANPSYTATLVKSASSGVASNTLYGWGAVEIVGQFTYRNQPNGWDLLVGPAAGAPIPIGMTTTINGLIYQTTAAGTLLAGRASTLAIATSAVVAGKAGNIIANAIDTLNGKGTLTSPPTGVEHAINDSAFSNGDEQESDDDRARRFQITVQGLTGSTVKGLEAAALSVAGVRSVTVRERFPEPGTNTIVADDGSGALPLNTLLEIQRVLDGDPDDFINYPGKRAAGILTNVTPPASVPVNVTLTVFRIGNLSNTTEITNNVQSAIENYVNTRRLGDDVVLSELIRVAKSAHPAVYDVTIAAPVANVSINSSSVSRTGAGTGAAVTITLTTLPTVP